MKTPTSTAVKMHFLPLRLLISPSEPPRHQYSADGMPNSQRLLQSHGPTIRWHRGSHTHTHRKPHRGHIENREAMYDTHHNRDLKVRETQTGWKLPSGWPAELSEVHSNNEGNIFDADGAQTRSFNGIRVIFCLDCLAPY